MKATSSPWSRPVWVTVTVVGAVYTLIAILLDQSQFAGYDIAAYWALEPTDPYRVIVAPALGAFLYSPPIAWLLAPVGLLDLTSARVAWLAMEVGILAILGGPLTVLASFLTPLRYELLVGNISLPMAACILLGLRRWPAAWAFPILAKVTPVVGLAWFVGRRDWHGLVWAGGLTVLLIGVTYPLVPGLWQEWVSLLQANAGVATDVDLGPLWLRATLAIIACWWAGHTNRAWIVPIAVALSLGHVWLSGLTIMVASIPLIWDSVDAHRSGGMASERRDRMLLRSRWAWVREWSCVGAAVAPEAACTSGVVRCRGRSCSRNISGARVYSPDRVPPEPDRRTSLSAGHR